MQTPLQTKPHWQLFLGLCKIRVVFLMLLCSYVGMILSTPTHPPMKTVLLGLLGIGLCACAGGACNHLIEKNIDKTMHRTKNRPLALGKLKDNHVIQFIALLVMCSMAVLYFCINPLTAALTLATMIGYAFIYTGFLKYSTPQNIVIGGLSGALPPLLGWTSVTGSLDPLAWVLVLIIFVWTPPHFWALAIDRVDDYRRSKIPMLPNTHGIDFTKLSILLYTILTVLVVQLPYLLHLCGLLYWVGANILNVRFLYWSIKLFRSTNPKIPMKTFTFSIHYLGILFLLMIVDHYL
ncbi:MAG TPA: heme o synthase [Gammaproteobacteria bacterium]|nr:heme o synthase [Gammaproteobacteria bacterium]